MALEEYDRKRDFDKTPEPLGVFSDANKNRFVVQRHRASRLHYDLRLEIDGVLKSWAVPKGPSMNPNDKRLAIQTEDHPVAYLDFHGVIPKGNYGAGEMTIWDQGTFAIAPEYENLDIEEQLCKGDLKIAFFGDKIKGSFALVHTKRQNADDHWLLIKKTDAFSTDLDYDAELLADPSNETTLSKKVKPLHPDTFVKPMLATAVKTIFNDKDWVYELKWDGYRTLAHITDGKVQLHSRNGISYNSKFKPIVRDLELLQHDVILDGEIVIVNTAGIPQFQALQNYTASTPGTLRFYVFDMIYLNGHSMLELSLLERKSLLPNVLEGLFSTLYCDHIEGMGTALFEKAINAGMEGVIAKKIDSTYSPGYRSEKWLKIKSVETEEAIICGYTDSVKGGSRFGSLILGMYSNGDLIYIGNCGSGYNVQEQDLLLSKMKNIAVKKCPFEKKPNLKGRKPNWIRPELVCEVKFSEWTKNGIMRHPVYKGIRHDKIKNEISTPKVINKVISTSSSSTTSSLDVDGIPVPISNLNKVLWPNSGYTKYDLIDYYLEISDYILPYLVDRPQSLNRHPNGIDKKSFYQKDHDVLPDWIGTKGVYSKSSDKVINYLLCQNEATLLYMANLGCVEINPWHSRIQNLDKPDYTIIDLDPSESNTFEEVIIVAQAVKEVLDTAKIKGYCKTSGSSGLHIYIPLNAQYTYEEGRNFTKLLCYFVEQKVPKLTSMTRAVKDRKGKIYLDYLQNRKGQTIAAPYCIRPKPGAPISAPLEWDEVRSGLNILDFNIKNFQRRLNDKGDLFDGLLSDTIDMMVAIEKLESS